MNTHEIRLILTDELLSRVQEATIAAQEATRTDLYPTQAIILLALQRGLSSVESEIQRVGVPTPRLRIVK